MAFHYEVVTEPALAALFRQKFLENMGKTKCCEMFRLVAPGMPNFWEFKAGKDIIMLSFTEEADERRERLVIDSMTLDLTDTILQTIHSGMMDYLMNFLAPLARMPATELEGRIKAQLEGLETVIKPKTLWDINKTGS
ncbi:MAG: hypothetical protein Q8O16_06215 [Dehalococcoidia bacterium]|nr:hypothetical protein [Dehalococcoidia bacterium]